MLRHKKVSKSHQKEERVGTAGKLMVEDHPLLHTSGSKLQCNLKGCVQAVLGLTENHQ